MPKFIIAHSLKGPAEKYPILRQAIWLVEAAIFRLFFGVIRLLPVETASRLGQRIATAAGPHLKKHQVFKRNIAAAFPDKTEHDRAAILKGIWANLGAIVGEFPHLQTICHDEKHKRLRIAVAGSIQALQQSGKPVIIVTAHLSNWEVAGAALAQMGIPCGDAYTPMGNPWLDRMIGKYREPLGLELFPRADSMRPMVKHLAAGHSLAFLIDQRIDNGRAVPFMGIEKKTTVVPAKLGLRFNCEIVPMRVQRLGAAQYLVTFYAPVQVDDPTASEADKVMQITRKLNQQVEQWVRERPHEWFPSKRRWDKILMNEAVLRSEKSAEPCSHALK